MFSIIKRVRSPMYNYDFNMKNGDFARWGKNFKDDPQFSPFGPELLDIEVSTICHGGCPWCYKSNAAKGKNMSFDTFKMIFDKVPKNLTQIAFGVGDLDANPDLWKMFEYCRKNKVIPNVTINGTRINGALADKLVNSCGAVAVSHYEDDACFNAVKMLTERKLKQVNIHQLVAVETLESCYQLLDVVKRDERLANLNAILFLSFKSKGQRNSYHPLRYEEFSKLIKNAMNQEVRMGFDSCSANKILHVLRNHPNYEMFKMMAEPCESTCFSQYINVDGIAYPCSFLEGEQGYEGMNVFEAKSFLKEIWHGPSNVRFRKLLIENQRRCPRFEIYARKA